MARQRRAFTIIELLMVAFILSIMVAILLPAIQKYYQVARKKQSESYLATLRLSLGTYLTDFGKYPPGEPDMAGTTYYGGYALLYYLNGTNGTGYGGKPPRVAGVPSNGSVFVDAWGNSVEYFLAYKGRAAWRSGTWPARTGLGPGEATADIYPRACNIDLTGSNDYQYNGSGSVISGAGIRVPIVRWLNGFTDYTQVGWQTNSVPANAGGYLLVSKGADGLWGTSDDVGDVGNWQ
ncbi:MAG: prepilin-type N-terminal cleavage/methylation domain-containing protein [Phycisphaerae bacterium]|nr:prepilin-type N-terminal cleavage/methylation domain-containing protein [Phycisphaerae bacterium]